MFCDVGDYDTETLMYDFKLAINELKEIKKILDNEGVRNGTKK